jgi:hypothetical protein
MCIALAAVPFLIGRELGGEMRSKSQQTVALRVGFGDLVATFEIARNPAMNLATNCKASPIQPRASQS